MHKLYLCTKLPNKPLSKKKALVQAASDLLWIYRLDGVRSERETIEAMASDRI